MTVRLSEDEYRSLSELAIVEGARSMSDMARDAIRAFISKRLQLRTRGDPPDLANLRNGIRALSDEIERISRRIGTARAAVSAASSGSREG